MIKSEILMSLYTTDPTCVKPMYNSDGTVDGYAKADFSNMVTAIISQVEDSVHLEYLGSVQNSPTDIKLDFSNDVSLHISVDDNPGSIRESDEVRTILENTGRKWYVNSIRVGDQLVLECWRVSFVVVDYLQKSLYGPGGRR